MENFGTWYNSIIAWKRVVLETIIGLLIMLTSLVIQWKFAYKKDKDDKSDKDNLL